MARTKVIFFVPESSATRSAVLHSQVLSVAQYLQANGINCMFVGSDSLTDADTDPAVTIKENYGIDAVVFNDVVKKRGFLNSFVDVYLAYRKIRKVLHSYEGTHIYTRSPVTALFARALASENDLITVLDARGALAEEIAFKRKRKGIRYHVMRVLESNEYRKSHRLVCVSLNLKEYIRTETGREDILVIPSCYDKKKLYFDREARERFRARYDLGETDKLLCYSGGLSPWQRIDDIISLFVNISKRDKRYRLLVLTQEADRLRALIEANGFSSENLIVIHALHGEVYQYLSAADAGIIMREDTIVNNVASPIKIGEYLGCGLPIILTKGIGDFSSKIVRHDIGLLLDEEGDTADQVISFFNTHASDELRERAIRFSQSYLAIESHLADYQRLYL